MTGFGTFGSATGLWMAGIVFRNANTALRSSSVSVRSSGQGAGRRDGAALGAEDCMPVPDHLDELSSVQLPRPVSLSGVRFAE